MSDIGTGAGRRRSTPPESQRGQRQTTPRRQQKSSRTRGNTGTARQGQTQRGSDQQTSRIQHERKAGALSARHPTRTTSTMKFAWRSEAMESLVEMTQSTEISEYMQTAMHSITSLYSDLCGVYETGRAARLTHSLELLEEVGNELELGHPPPFEGLHSQEILAQYRGFHAELRTQIVLAYVREQDPDAAWEALEAYWETELQEHRAALTLQRTQRGKATRASVVAMFSQAGARRQNRRQGVLTATALRKLRDYRHGRTQLDILERNKFAHLLRVVEACARYPDEDVLGSVPAPPNVAVLELQESIKPLLTWLGNLTNWLSVLTMGRIVARRKDPMLGMTPDEAMRSGRQQEYLSQQQQYQQRRGSYGGNVQQQRVSQRGSERGGGYGRGRGAQRDDLW